jgi:hypothetical protein
MLLILNLVSLFRDFYGHLLGSRLYATTQDFTVIGVVALVIGLIAPLLLFLFMRHLD